MADEFANKSEAECILSYRAKKGHRTRAYRKIEKHINLRSAKYSILAEKAILEEIKKIEAHQTFKADFLCMGGVESSNQYVAKGPTIDHNRCPS